MSLYSERVAQDSPLFYFENNSSGVNNTGSITPSITTGSSTTFASSGGVSGSPYMINAARTGEYGFEYSNSATIFNDRVFSITGWFKVNSTDISTNPDYIFHAGTTSNGVFLQKTDKLYVGANFNAVSVATSTAPSFDAWHHVAVTMDTTNLKLYVDGTLIQTVSSPASLSIDSLVKYWGRATTSGTPRNGVKGNLDEWAVFNTTLSATTISEHYETGFGVKINETPATATALAVDPAISAIANISIIETPATATALATDTQVSNFNTPTMLDGYLAGRSLEQWFKFDEIGKIHNYGSGGDAELAWAFNGASVNVPEAGIQGSGALKIKGEVGNSVVLAFGVNEPYFPEITDNEFSVGVWFKAESSFKTKIPRIFVVLNPFGDDSYNLLINDVGFATWVATGTQTHIATYNTVNVCDGNWHLIQVRASDANNQIAISVDNGTEVTTAINGNTWPQNLGYMALGATYDAGTNNSYGYISNMWITGYSSIGSTERAAMITAAAVPIQAAAGMVQPVVKFDNAYNILLDTYSPKIAFRLNEASGAPINFGSGGTLSVGKNGSNITYLQPTQNTYAYKFTNADTFIQGDYSYASGTFSSGNHQTMSAVFKAESTVNFEQLIGSMGMYGFLGSGITLSIGATNGYLEARINQGFGETDTDFLGTTINVCDNQYHHVVGVRDGSIFKLYLDGKQVATMSDAVTTLSDAATYAISGEGKFNFGQEPATKALHIDEFAVLSSALSANEVFGLYQSLSNATEWTASALAVQPSVATGTGAIVNSEALTASAESPFFIAPSIYAATGTGLFQQPNFEAIKNTDNLADAMTAEAQGENPGWDIGENNQVLHMDASAEMPEARALIPGFWNASPAIANPAEMVDPAISSTLGALIKPESMTAKAILPTPPAYKLLTDDIWYSKLYLQHSVVHNETGNTPGSSSAYAFLKLFDDVTSNLSGAVTSKLTNNLPWSIVIDNPDATATTVTYATASNEFLTATPEPLLEVGTYDDYERKSVRFRNTQFKVAEDVFKAEGPYSLEFTFKSTKSNQVIAQSFQRSFLGNQRATGSIGLVDGKLFATRVTQEIGGATIFAHPDNTNLVSTPSRISTAYGNKRIDDGLWHHIIVQHGFDGRVQFWIDGQLDIQFFGDSIYGRGGRLRPYIFGSNHTNPRWQSDFETSAWSYDAAFFVDSENIIEHYTASIKYEPVHAEPALATANMPEPVVAGNRPRALMLYFWPTSTGQVTNLSYANFTSNESPEELQTLDYFTAPPQNYEGWDVFPVDVTGRYVSDLVKPEAYGVENIQLTTLSGTVSGFGGPQQTLKVNKRRTFRDLLTDAPRYIDLINDIDLTKFDMIMFKNYPNDPAEKDSFTGTEVVDEYFNLRESKLFEDFLKSLRAAVDTGLSLMVSNAQLALDLKIVDRVEIVPDMDDNVGQGNYSDLYSPTQMFGVSEALNLPVPPQYREPLGWQDSWKNNRTRIVNTHSGITDYPSLIKTQQAFWQSTDEFRWGGADRMFMRYEDKNALAVGDEFVISTTGRKGDNNRQGYLATPFENVKAGKIITAFANTIRRGLDEIQNPYANYAQSIVLEPGDVLDGTQVGGKIFVNFTEEINKCEESVAVELISDYWVNYAYNNGAIDLATRDELLAAEYNQDTTPYWSLNGMNLLQQAGTEFELDTDFARKGVQKNAVKTRKVNKNGGISFQNVPQGSVFFSSTYSWRYPMASLETPSMPTRGFRWLSNREVIDGTVIRPQAFTATAEMPNAAGVPDRVINVTAQSMVASALIEETQFSSGERKLLALPMEANATIVKPGSTIGVEPMLANAGMFANGRARVASEDQVVLQIIHVDPILYIREDVIK